LDRPLSGDRITPKPIMPRDPFAAVQQANVVSQFLLCV
jgi:hypothetical protein